MDYFCVILSLVLYTSTFISSLFANWCIGKLPSIGLNVKNYIIYSIRGKTGVLFHVDSPGSFFHTHYNAELCCGGCLCVLCFHVASVLIPMCVVSICCLFSYVYSCHPFYVCFCNISETGERRLGKGTHLICRRRSEMVFAASWPCACPLRYANRLVFVNLVC